jgi:EAL domain-containing protein (putative c-di-GMP-specific phosphodiesterase class I)
MHECGCDIGQGYAFAPALDSTSLATWIEQWRQRNDMPNILPATVA